MIIFEIHFSNFFFSNAIDNELNMSFFDQGERAPTKIAEDFIFVSHLIGRKLKAKEKDTES